MTQEKMIESVKGNVENLYDTLQKIGVLDGCDDTKKEIIRQQIAVCCVNTISDYRNSMPNTPRVQDLL